jgi:hypothetical protein
MKRKRMPIDEAADKTSRLIVPAMASYDLEPETASPEKAPPHHCPL